jgi:hypothetical protein
MRRLAKEFGLSDVGLSKICRKNDIPTPPLGYWAKKQHGKAVRQTPLPTAKTETEKTITITEQPPRPPDPPPPARPVVEHPEIAALIAEAEKPENKVVVANTLHGLHPLVTVARKGFADAQPGTYGLLHPGVVDGKTCLNLTISKGAIDRALRLMNTLLKALDRHGFKATYTDDGWRKELRLTLSDESLELRLREKTKRQPHVMTPAEVQKKAKYNYSFAPSYDYMPTGVFDLGASCVGRFYCPQRSWSESGGDPLEERLTEVVVGLLELVDAAKVARAEKERQERAERDHENRRYELRQKREKEQQRVDELIDEASSWKKAQLIREYLGGGS